MAARTQREFMMVTSAALPLWLAMILFPRSAATRRLMTAVPAWTSAVGAVYGGLLLRTALQRGLPANLFDGEGWREVLASPQGFVTGWTHFVVFDLFVGRWIWETALAEGRGCRVALILSCLAGPLGLLLFHLQRRFAPRPAGAPA
jgi:hypothetical protein